MSRALRVLLLAVVAGFLVTISSAALADCGVQAEVGEVTETCDFSSGDIEGQKLDYPMAQWSVVQICKDGGRRPDGLCYNPDDCTTAAGVPGTRYTLFRDGENVGTACLAAGEVEKVDDPPPVRDLVIEAFQALDWKPSELTVQPKNGKTLVNLKTNFFTTNTDVSSIPVQLIRARVVVSARPIAYRWNFGDGSSITTSSPGAPYPSLDVSHAYDRTDEVVVSVDTQYGDASFTVNGGPPEAIPSTIWVDGATQDLAIVEALPQLVIR
ncbi:hypothetical protein KDN32_02280 [Nocardioides sp. J2M5]|uniref:hypothetical protein n=1 Tax=Nocardioides palaemonis TaxID=2829810 RepID=UPI001BAD0982|nr:hypothetical protein [Nocardioides palaemonis]MBS2936566.1 hypothetical protein [Nocardioides palaemonis]